MEFQLQKRITDTPLVAQRRNAKQSIIQSSQYVSFSRPRKDGSALFTSAWTIQYLSAKRAFRREQQVSDTFQQVPYELQTAHLYISIMAPAFDPQTDLHNLADKGVSRSTPSFDSRPE